MVAPGDGFSIRPAAADDMGVVASLFREYADALGVNLSYQGFDAELTALPGAYAQPGGALLLAVSGGGVLGVVALRPLAETGCCEMKRLYVRPAGRGTGVGRALAAAVIKAATAAGYAWIRLDTLPTMTSAQNLYRQLGFELTPAYYGSAVAGTIFMRRALGSPKV